MSKFGILILTISGISGSFSFYHNNNWIPGEHGYHGVHNGFEHAKSFSNEWIVVVDGGEEVAQLVALELGYVYGGPVRWAEQLFTKSRVKRYPMPDPDAVLYREKRIELYNITRKKRTKENNLFNDELWSQQWYLQDTRTVNNLPRLDLNVIPVYAMGYNGSGVRVSVLDDGIEYNHTDLRDNYDPEISWDCNDQDPDPSPRYEEQNRNSHGTRCAGEIAMVANNVKCGVGMSWGARVGGVRMLDGRITDRIEGEAIGHAWDKVDIYSASWGPNDDGRTVEGPGRLAMEALERGVSKGRGGKGSIYVWANGNGGRHRDNCNCDGYSSSIYTISIGSASQHGLFPWYGEICSSTLATAYSSGAYRDQKIATTDINNSCTLGHTGTSAAAPLVAGIVALALQANPNLTWRDVQHLIVWTSEYAPLSANPGWQINGIGLRFDIRFGFGLLNAGALVASALNWTTVPEKQTCRVEALPLKEGYNKIVSTTTFKLFLNVDDCAVNYLEHVELVINIRYTRRGALDIRLLSPQGTEVQLLSPRPRDISTAGFINWPLMSVATWGERPQGIWKLIIDDQTNEQNVGEIGQTTLIVHGTTDMPAHMKKGSRKYNYDYNYQKVFDYYNNLDSARPGSNSDNNKAPITDNHNANADLLYDIDPQLLNVVEEELQRIHHRKDYQVLDYE